MADPFEVRMRFSMMLQNLNASTTSAVKAANMAVRHAEYSDDLHSCILEQLERNNMNSRANIMYFLPALCETAKAQSAPDYVRMIERDILRIIDLVAPDDGSGAANVKVVRKVLQQLQQKGFLPSDSATELEECIAGRESAHGAPASPGTFAKPGTQQQPAEGTAAAGAGKPSGAGAGVITPAMRSTPQSASHHDAAGHFHHPGVRLDRRQIEQRIEEDRERHKRAREGIWAVPQPSANLAEDSEFTKMWNETGPADEDDYQKAKEEAQERAKHLGSAD